MIYLGIDPGGTTGALAILDDTSVRPSALTFTTIQDMKGWILQEDLDRGSFATIELVHSIYGSAAKANFEFGKNLGEWIGLMTGLGIPYQLIPPQRWQKEMLPGKPQRPAVPHKGKKLTKEQASANRAVLSRHKAAIKAYAASVAVGLWPDVDFRRTERCQGPHDGMVDAALIAEYGRRTQGRKV